MRLTLTLIAITLALIASLAHGWSVEIPTLANGACPALMDGVERDYNPCPIYKH